MKSQLFQYAILFNPDLKENDNREPKVIKGIETILAKNQEEATIRIAREIPEEYLNRLDEIDIVCRPF